MNEYLREISDLNARLGLYHGVLKTFLFFASIYHDRTYVLEGFGEGNEDPSRVEFRKAIDNVRRFLEEE